MDLPGRRLRAALVKCFEEWIGRRHGCMNYYLTHLLTGHGCFNAYLQRIRKAESVMCKYCDRAIDNVEHTLMKCEEWNAEREELKVAMEKPVNMENITIALGRG